MIRVFVYIAVCFFLGACVGQVINFQQKAFQDDYRDCSREAQQAISEEKTPTLINAQNTQHIKTLERWKNKPLKNWKEKRVVSFVLQERKDKNILNNLKKTNLKCDLANNPKYEGLFQSFKDTDLTKINIPCDDVKSVLIWKDIYTREEYLKIYKNTPTEKLRRLLNALKYYEDYTSLEEQQKQKLRFSCLTKKYDQNEIVMRLNNWIHFFYGDAPSPSMHPYDARYIEKY